MMNVKTHIRMTASELATGRYMRAPEHPADDAFGDAFAGFAKDEPPAAAAGGDDDGVAAAAAAGGDDTGVAAAGDDAAGVVVADDKGGGSGADDAAAVAAAAEAAKTAEAVAPPVDDAAAQAAAAAAKPTTEPVDTDALLRRMAEHVKAAPVDSTVTAATAEEPMFNEDEQKVIAKFEEDWPEVNAALLLKQRQFADGLLKYTFKEIMGEFAPIRDMVNAMAARTHQADITSKVGELSDADIDVIEAWAKEPIHPPYLQQAYLGVIKEGTASEVADLVDRYREAKGLKTAPAVDPNASRGEELSEEAKKAAAALAPVDSKRSVVTKADDPDDFDGAFAKFATTES